MKSFVSDEGFVRAFYEVFSDLLEVLSADSFCMMAVDCHPWDGVVEISFLTDDEFDQDPFLLDPEEMAAWKYYHISKESSKHDLLNGVALKMKNEYFASSSKSEYADAVFEMISETLKSPGVSQLVGSFKTRKGLKVSVANPDNAKEYYI
jgi:hypothetical protein